MKSHHRQVSQRGKRSRKAGLSSLGAVALVAALSLSALVLAGASSMQSSHSGNSIPAAIAPQATGQKGAARLAPSSGAEAEGSFHPGMLPVVAGAWTAEG